jgi:hypothetical protein
MSNVRGPAQPVYVLGWPVSELYTLSEIAQGHALRIAAISSSGTLAIGLLADSSAVTDLLALADDIRLAAAELLAYASWRDRARSGWPSQSAEIASMIMKCTQRGDQVKNGECDLARTQLESSRCDPATRPSWPPRCKMQANDRALSVARNSRAIAACDVDGSCRPTIRGCPGVRNAGSSGFVGPVGFEPTLSRT